VYGLKKVLGAILLSITFLMTSCNALGNKGEAKPPESQVDVTPPVIERKEITIVATGDIMLHSTQITSALKGKAYDFKSQFEGIKSEIEGADIAIGNFETTINPKKKPAGYPMFNAPVEILDALRHIGFDVLTTANNHSVDTGKEGIVSTVDSIKQYGMIPVGTGNPEDEKFGIIEKNDVRVGVLAYTYGTNGIKSPEGMVNHIDPVKIKADVAKIKKMADFIVVYIHTGTEYVRKVEDYQYTLFREIADSGADAVIGSHPHVARKSEVYETNGRKVFINYSLGNFTSSQDKKYTDIGLLVRLKISKTDSVQIDDAEVVPVYRLRYKESGKTMFNVVPYNKIDSNSKISSENKNYIKSVFNEVAGENYTEVFSNK
jgi:poly-gamma-glutamate capsule biosynthesis protein CapA/YwtB (metallophosphatase superfamily)